MKSSAAATPAPKSLRVKGTSDVVELGEIMGSGTYNLIAEAKWKGLPVVVRTSQPAMPLNTSDALLEQGFMKVLSKHGVHPIVHGLGLSRVSAGGRGSQVLATTVMQRAETSLDKWLEAGGESSTEEGAEAGRRAARSLLRQFCRISDLGFCLVDIKPGNAVVTGEDVMLIDVDPAWSFYMDPGLVAAATSNPLGKSQTAAQCARARGLSYYLMTLLMYLFVKEDEASTPRYTGFVDALRRALKASCVPTYALASLKGKLAESLTRILNAYVFQRDDEDPRALSDLRNLVVRDGLSQPGCATSVQVNGVKYDSEGSHCSDEDWSLVYRVNGRHYPCPIPAEENPARRYAIQKSRASEFGKEIKVPVVSSRALQAKARGPRAGSRSRSPRRGQAGERGA